MVGTQSKLDLHFHTIVQTYVFIKVDQSPGCGITFRDTGGYQKAGISSLKRVTGKNFAISK